MVLGVTATLLVGLLLVGRRIVTSAVINSNDQVERCCPEASSLVALVDQQLPQVVGDVVGAADLVCDHHEPDRRLSCMDRPEEGVRIRFLRRLGNRLPNTLTSRS